MHHCLSMQLTSQDKTPAVISRAMAKHNLEGEQAADYELVQVISEERGTTWPFEILLLKYIICLGLLWWNANITFTIFFPSFSRIGHPRQRQRVLRHEHICELWLPLASAWFWGEAGSAAQSLQLHTTAHTATLQSVPQAQQGHTVTTAGGVLENRLFQGEFIDFRNISELI